MLGFYAAKLISLLILPPLILIWPPLLAWLFRKPRLAHRLAGLSLVLFTVFSLPVVSNRLLRSLEIAPALDLKHLPEAHAIVILGNGCRFGSLEYGGHSVNAETLERLRYAAQLYRLTRLPVLVTGGAPKKACPPEAALMAQTLDRDFRVPVQWIENQSLTTWDNARYSAVLLRKAGIKRIYLVSHAWHLRRAMPLFEREGFEVIPAGTGFSRHDRSDIFEWLPTRRAYSETFIALHEWLGILWYKVRPNF